MEEKFINTWVHDSVKAIYDEDVKKYKCSIEYLQYREDLKSHFVKITYSEVRDLFILGIRLGVEMQKGYLT